MLAIIALAGATTILPYDPPSTPIDNAVARVQLSAGAPGVVTRPHTHPTSRVMIYFQDGTNTIRFPDGKVSAEHFKAGDAQWNDAMGSHTAEITARGPVDIVHVELKSPPGMVPAIPYAARDPLAVDPAHFQRAIENNQVRVLRFHLGRGEKTPLYAEPFARLLVPLTPARLTRTDADGRARTVACRQGEMQWWTPGTGAEENAGDAPFEAVLVEFRK